MAERPHATRRFRDWIATRARIWEQDRRTCSLLCPRKNVPDRASTVHSLVPNWLGRFDPRLGRAFKGLPVSCCNLLVSPFALAGGAAGIHLEDVEYGCKETSL